MSTPRLVALLAMLRAARAVIHGGRVPLTDEAPQPVDDSLRPRRESDRVVRAAPFPTGRDTLVFTSTR
jgi:hypothetical protein